MSNNQFTGVNPNDLMIGNYVMYEGMMYQVDTIYSDSVGIGVLRLEPNMIQPVSLTPELLERCGFKRQYNKVFIRTTISLLHSIGLSQYDDTQWRILINGNYAGVIHLQYLHEFQNLYYSLTKTKLELCDTKTL